MLCFGNFSIWLGIKQIALPNSPRTPAKSSRDLLQVLFEVFVWKAC